MVVLAPLLIKAEACYNFVTFLNFRDCRVWHLVAVNLVGIDNVLHLALKVVELTRQIDDGVVVVFLIFAPLEAKSPAN